MFDRLVESTNERRSARTWIFFAASSVTWSVVLASVAIAGVFMADARLDADFDRLNVLVPPPHSAPPSPRARSSEPIKPKNPAPVLGLIAIVRHNETIAPPRPPAPNGGVSYPGGTDNGDPRATGPGEPFGTDPVGLGKTPGGTAIPVPAPPAPSSDLAADARATPAPRRPKHIGVISGLATRRVEPPYPELAKAIGAQGSVVVSVTVSETGRVLEANAVSGHPSLRQASIDAARRWQFSPTMLNGIPVKVIGTITFNFRKS
jgi:protein TonB